jgi:2-isopropylmalate synthase
VTVQVLTQARRELIERTFESLRGIKRAVVHVYNSTSPVQREQVFKAGKEEIIGIAVNGARLLKEGAARHRGVDWTFEYSPESFWARSPSSP